MLAISRMSQGGRRCVRARVVVVMGMCCERDGGADTREIHRHEPAQENSVGTRLVQVWMFNENTT